MADEPPYRMISLYELERNRAFDRVLPSLYDMVFRGGCKVEDIAPGRINIRRPDGSLVIYRLR